MLEKEITHELFISHIDQIEVPDVCACPASSSWDFPFSVIGKGSRCFDSVRICQRNQSVLGYLLLEMTEHSCGYSGTQYMTAVLQMLSTWALLGLLGNGLGKAANIRPWLRYTRVFFKPLRILWLSRLSQERSLQQRCISLGEQKEIHVSDPCYGKKNQAPQSIMANSVAEFR